MASPARPTGSAGLPSSFRRSAAIIRLLLFSVIVCFGCTAHTLSPSPASAPSPPSQPIEFEPGLRIRQVASGAFESTHELPWPANSLLVAMADETLVLAGTPHSPEATQRVLAWARTRFGERRLVAIKTVGV